MNPESADLFIQYLSSGWGILANGLFIILFGMIAYNTYAKRWSAKTGQFFTEAKITWSELTTNSKGQSKALIRYNYNVNGVLHNGVIPAHTLRPLSLVDEHPKGKLITVYFSQKDHGYSTAHKPPTHVDIIMSVIGMYLMLPVLIYNCIAFFIYWLANAPH